MKLWGIKAEIIKQLSERYGSFEIIKDKESCVFVLQHRNYNEEKEQLIKEEVITVEDEGIRVSVNVDIYRDDKGRIAAKVYLYTTEIEMAPGGTKGNKNLTFRF